MTKYRSISSTPDARWRHDHNNSMSRIAVRSVGTWGRDYDYRYHEIAHWLAGNAAGAEADFVTIGPTLMENDVVVPACVRWKRTADDPFSRLVTTLAGEAFDVIDGLELSESSHDRANVRKLADAYVQLYGGDQDSIIETAWQRALQFCRENESL